MSESGLEKLKLWTGSLDAVSLSQDGTTLTKGDDSIDASESVEIQFQAKSCKYTLASIFLQIVDPNQSLLQYRTACRKHGVKDAVKALDKPNVVGYFLGSEALEEKLQEPPAPPIEEREHKKSRRDSSRHKRRSTTKDKKDRHKRKPEEAPDIAKEKKKRKELTDEQLFSNLEGVVDKRSSASKEQQDAIRAALSSDGFQDLNKETVERHKEETELIVSMEIPVGNSASILRSSASETRDFSRVLELYLETTKPQKPDKFQAKGSSKSGRKSHLAGKKPIIIVPKGMTAPLTMVNAHEFFSNAQFVPRDMQLKRFGRSNPPKSTFKRKVSTRLLGGAEVEYEIMDNPMSKLGRNSLEWERVVAVIALGAAWQFKDWYEDYSNPVSLFSRTFGFYIGMEGDPLPKDLMGWSVKRGKLNRDKRGLDSVTFASFWNGLDEWMAVHKRELVPQSEK